MSRQFLSILLLTLSAVLSGCDKNDSATNTEQPISFIELLEAYKSDRMFLSAEPASGKYALIFSDDYIIYVPESDFKVYDCTESSPAKVSLEGAHWSVGGVNLGIKADYSKSTNESLPVYVYFDKVTLYAHLSNGVVLKFWSEVLEDEKIKQEDNEKLQNIPVIRIKTLWDAEIKDKKNYVDGTITITDPEKMYSEVTEFTADMGIRGRGNSTWEWPKKPWKVKLDDKASLLGMPADKEWALLANYSDRTLLRNVVAMKLSEICGFSWTPRMRSVEVYLNNEYQGVYTLCEHKKVAKDRVNIDIDSGDCYLEIEQNQDETTCWLTGMGVPMMFSDPEEPVQEQYEYITGLFDEFEMVLQSDGFADPVTGYSAYIDVKSFIDNYIVQELTKNIDGNIRKSSFITKQQGKKLEMYHLWDFDLTLGNCGYFDGNIGNGPESFYIKNYGSDCTYGTGWYFRLFQDPAFVDAVQDRWNELYPEFQKIPDFIDKQAFSLAPSIKRNFEKWDINESVGWVNMPSKGSYEAELEYLKQFYSSRLVWMNTYLLQL